MEKLIKYLLSTIATQTLISAVCFGQLTIYSGVQQSGTTGSCLVNTIYKGINIPTGLDNQISSISLSKGYMATLAENEDGTGYSYPFTAVTNDLSINLPASMDDKVSFIRVLPITAVKKKGIGYQNNTVIDQLNVSWFYDWGPNDVSTVSRDYAPMAWGAGAANSTNVNNYIAKTDVSHLLSFNEPDNSDQSNITYQNAVPLHNNLAATGFRLGSPATTEDEAKSGRWLNNFMTLASTNNVRVDYVAIHWYDWGSYSSTNNTNPDVDEVFTRFKAYVNLIYKLYKKPIWITEFNANRNTTEQTHINFMALALPWLEAQPFVERYAYFFPPALPPVDNFGVLTPIGNAYKNFASQNLAISKNLDGVNDTTTYEAENATLSGVGITSCTTASNGQIVAATSGSNKITYNNVFVPSANNYKLRIYYYSKNTARNLMLKINSGTSNVIAIPGTSNWCYEGASAGYYDVTVSLTAGNNVIEFSEAPILDKIQIIKIPYVSTLPISLTSFDGNATSNGVKLEWSTAQEINNDYFEVFKSENNIDFKLLDRLSGAKNSNSRLHYSLMDYNPSVGINYYQLKQYDLDGKVTVFNPIALKYGMLANEIKLNSISDESVNITISSDKSMDGKLSYISLEGKAKFQQNIQLKKGLNYFSIPVEKITSELALINLITPEYQKSIKVLR